MARTGSKGRRAGEPPMRKDWWRSFFGRPAGMVMFEPRAQRSAGEVEIVLRRTRTKPGARILDVACGTGRHTLIFAAKGYEVVGLDYSAPYLRQARAALRKARLDGRAKLVRGDMRHASRHVGRNGFDLAVSLYNSFGYFDRRSDDKRMLREIFRALRPGGAFVLNTLNEGGVRHRLRRPMQAGHEPLRNVFMIDAVRYDKKKRRTQGNWTIVDARRPRVSIARLKLAQNVYSHAELKAMLRAAGFRIERVWGMLEGARFNPKTWHQTIVARRPV
jgi:SAM-dependent methyltransferase